MSSKSKALKNKKEEKHYVPKGTIWKIMGKGSKERYEAHHNRKIDRGSSANYPYGK